MVSAGQADVAAIDVITLTHLAAIEPEVTDGLRIIAETPPSPNLPLVTARYTSPEVVGLLRAALDHAMRAPSLADAR